MPWYFCVAGLLKIFTYARYAAVSRILSINAGGIPRLAFEANLRFLKALQEIET